MIEYATLLAAQLRRREISASDVVEASLARIAEREPSIHAWATLDAEFARHQARALDAGPVRGPLHGLPIGVKDIIDTADLPTECGSPIDRGRRPQADAACVALARAVGAVVLGKTVTTEFAMYTPAATVNPRNGAHTPGGSSSGSAAAVADGMVPLAFGTQTAGSIVRPASYCGIVGYKPSFGLVPRAGVKLMAESLDTVGALARSVADAALLVGAIAGRPALLDVPSLATPPRIGVCRTGDWPSVEPAAQTAFDRAAQALEAAGARVRAVDLPQRFAALGAAHAAIMSFEAARSLAHERRVHADRLSARLRAELDAGAAVPVERYDEAQRLALECRAQLAGAFADCDVLLAPSTTGEAPRGLDSTGSPIMNRVWTLLHAPCVSVPAGQGPNGLPLGVQVVGRGGEDARALAAAQWIAARLG
jgi:Asp-tRNA(Asn)/Glu-tRNA(Gln) amidotransferase A subunit family amidase